MTVTWAELVREIRADPDSNALRLVAADWLMERGDPRGEYIALALRLATSDPRSVDPDGEMRRRYYSIDQSEAWRRELNDLGATHWNAASPELEYRRGFVEKIALVGANVARFSAICQLEPILELEVRDAGSACESLATAVELAPLRALSCGSNDALGCAHLFASPHLGRVRKVTSATPISATVGDALVAGALRPHQLDATFELEGARAMAAGVVLHELRNFDQWNASDMLIEALAETPLANLRGLALWDPTITSRALDALGDRLGKLERLTLRSRASFSPEVVQALIRHVTGGRLRRLDVDGFDESALEVLLSSPVLQGVEVLRFGILTPAIRRAFETSPYCASVRAATGPGGSLRTLE